jgi:hypothetical protein
VALIFAEQEYMKIDYLGSKVDLSKGPLTTRDDGPTGKPELQLLGEQVPLSRTPVSDFRSGVSEGERQLTGSECDLNRRAVAGYDGATLSTRASKQQGSGR